MGIEAHYRELLAEATPKRKYCSFAAKGVAVKAMQAKIGREMVQAMSDKLKDVVFLDEAPCCVHDRHCPLEGATCEAVSGDSAISVWSAGNSCLDWSTIGSQQGWSGLGCLVFMVWIRHAISRRRPGMFKHIVTLLPRPAECSCHNSCHPRCIKFC